MYQTQTKENKMSHECHHCVCTHINLAFCARCNVVYCKDCKKEWVEKVTWSWTTDWDWSYRPEDTGTWVVCNCEHSQ